MESKVAGVTGWETGMYVVPAGMPVPCGSKGPHLPGSCVVQRSDVCRRGGFNAGALVAESGNARVLATCVVC